MLYFEHDNSNLSTNFWLVFIYRGKKGSHLLSYNHSDMNKEIKELD